MTEELVTAPRTLSLIERHLAMDPRLKSPNTRRGYLIDLTAFERWRAGRALSKLLVEEYIARLQASDKSANSINRALAAIRWWARKVADLAPEDAAADAARRAAGVKDVTRTRSDTNRRITRKEFAALLRVCKVDPTPAGVRDAAVISLAGHTGARISELAGLQLTDIHGIGDEEADIVIRNKSDKTRVVHISAGTQTLRDWLKLRGSNPGPLFCPVNKGGKVQRGAPVGERAVAAMLEKRAAQAKLSQPITWHDFRRTFADNLLDAGTDLATVQKLMGHSSPTTTSIYDRSGEEAKRKAVRALHVPYRRRRAR